MKKFETVAELIALANEIMLPIHEVVIEREMVTSQRSREDLIGEMRRSWDVMQAAIKRGIENEEHSVSGLTGGDAKKIYAHREGGYLASPALSAAAYAVGVAEVNAVMGRIVACPTAGSCGIMPAALYSAKLNKGATDEEIVKALFTAAGIGMVIDQNASIAGAEGGCQAECGTATGMAAAALVELAGGTPEQCGNACALAIKNLLGLACDPVAGLVEVPCVKRNGFCVIHAMLAADMTLAGIVSAVPIDDVISALDSIGRAMPQSIRETAKGGLAATPTGQKIAERLRK
ncbi:MAG: L-serine ammonia-lyase, iron-sulfur-dependent, subunit alpha [Selenomonadaceae bacterium]